MISLSPKAFRYVTAALPFLPDDRRAEWTVLTAEHGSQLSIDASMIAFEALQIWEGKLRRTLELEGYDEDFKADIANDIGFICAIESDISQMLKTDSHR